MVRDVRSVIGAVRDKFGAAVLLVEQDASLALRVAERGYLLRHGRIVASASIGEPREPALMRELYFGEWRAAAGE
jgi:branched-chain amino acid transport system ATP-binding protein